jgi:RNA polymerase sigma-70 factor, ECF subfamily
MSDNAITPDDSASEAEFVRLFTSHQVDIYLFVHSLIPNPDAAEEIVQETNVALWEKHREFDVSRDFRVWAFSFARNKVLQFLEKHKRKCVCFSDALVNELAIRAPGRVMANDDRIDDLRHCVALLAAKDRKLLGLRYSARATCEAIAKTFGKPVTWVYNAMRRIRHELLDCIARQITARRDP